jgi:hypothetical protein
MCMSSGALINYVQSEDNYLTILGRKDFSCQTPRPASLRNIPISPPRKNNCPALLCTIEVSSFLRLVKRRRINYHGVALHCST